VGKHRHHFVLKPFSTGGKLGTVSPRQGSRTGGDDKEKARLADQSDVEEPWGQECRDEDDTGRKKVYKGGYDRHCKRTAPAIREDPGGEGVRKDGSVPPQGNWFRDATSFSDGATYRADHKPYSVKNRGPWGVRAGGTSGFEKEWGMKKNWERKRLSSL